MAYPATSLPVPKGYKGHHPKRRNPDFINQSSSPSGASPGPYYSDEGSYWGSRPYQQRSRIGYAPSGAVGIFGSIRANSSITTQANQTPAQDIYTPVLCSDYPRFEILMRYYRDASQNMKRELVVYDHVQTLYLDGTNGTINTAKDLASDIALGSNYHYFVPLTNANQYKVYVENYFDPTAGKWYPLIYDFHPTDGYPVGWRNLVSLTGYPGGGGPPGATPNLVSGAGWAWLETYNLSRYTTQSMAQVGISELEVQANDGSWVNANANYAYVTDSSPNTAYNSPYRPLLYFNYAMDSSYYSWRSWH